MEPARPPHATGLPAGRLLVISPHLDDAVLACGDLLSTRLGALIVTVCAGTPRDGGVLTEWDAACGFSSAEQAMAQRRAEDARALGAIGARAQWLAWLDDQYADDRRAHEPAGAEAVYAIAHDLQQAIRTFDAAVILCPLGLFHRDHQRVHQAARIALGDEPHRAWFAYEEAAYRRIPGLVQQRLLDLARHAIIATPVAVAPSGLRDKRRAIDCYASQLRGLATPGRPGFADALAPESYWHLWPTAPRGRTP